MDIESILAEAELPQTSVSLCLKGKLVAEYERLDAELQALSPAASLAGDGSAPLIARLDELRAEMLRYRVEFTFEARPPREFSDLRAKIPVKKEGQPDDEWVDLYHEWVCLLVATCCIEPAMTAEQVDQLSVKLSDRQWSNLSNAAYRVNTETQDIPFSSAAFVRTLTSGAKSKRHEQPEPPDPSSLAGNGDPSPSTNTKTEKTDSSAGSSGRSRPRKATGPTRTAATSSPSSPRKGRSARAAGTRST